MELGFSYFTAVECQTSLNSQYISRGMFSFEECRESLGVKRVKTASDFTVALVRGRNRNGAGLSKAADRKGSVAYVSSS